MSNPLTLLLTRPERQSQGFAEDLDHTAPRRFKAVISPVFQITPLEVEPDLEGVEGLLFTSANGVEQFVAKSDRRDPVAWCVGAITEAAAKRAGFETRSSDGDVEALASLVIEASPGGILLHVRGRHAAGDLTGRLDAAGIRTRAAEIYDQVARPLSAEAAKLLENGGIDIVTAFSPRSARLFAREAAAAEWPLDRTVAVSLSGAADRALGGLRFARRLTAPTPNRPGIMQVLLNL